MKEIIIYLYYVFFKYLKKTNNLDRSISLTVFFSSVLIIMNMLFVIFLMQSLKFIPEIKMNLYKVLIVVFVGIGINSYLFYFSGLYNHILNRFDNLNKRRRVFYNWLVTIYIIFSIVSIFIRF